jgi:hypothetical protein
MATPFLVPKMTSVSQRRNRINGTHHELIPGKLYNIRHKWIKDEPFTGIFIKYKIDWIRSESCVFEDPDFKTRVTIKSNRCIVKHSAHPMLAKQYARGLCDRIPEDCAGIIERLLVGDKIVGKGPDRYPERC